ncbi:E4 [Gammapapillomavirus 11]|uniref:E4 n=1 Tax=Gammapapillomavirus 11 TaxID=1513256 RepID=A0A2D2ALM5_9PAPI|nr:E4 [Gammapapillomavirus 11]
MQVKSGLWRTLVLIAFCHHQKIALKKAVMKWKCGLIMILKMHFHTLTGNGYIIKITMNNGIKYLEKLIIMDYILLSMMAHKHTFCYLKKMLIDMATQENGLLIYQMNKFFLPLLLALLGGIYLTPPRSTGGLPPPTPRPKRKSEEDRFNRRRQALALPRDHQEDDDDEEKENRPPPKDDEELKETEDLVQYLLKQLEKAINQYEQQILQELRDLRLKLGIRH